MAKLLNRRSLIKGMGLGAASPLLGSLMGRIVSDAQAASGPSRRFLFLTQGNAWSHSGDLFGSKAATNTGKKSKLFSARYASPTDFDLPAWAQSFAPYKNDVALWFGLYGYNDSLTFFPNHGMDSMLMTANFRQTFDEPAAGGISIDRLLGKRLQQRYGDIHQSTNMGPFCSTYKSAACPSYDDAAKLAPCYTSPAKAYAAYFGAVMNVSTPAVEKTLADKKSLFDGMVDDLNRARMKLAAGADRAKLDQAVESLREFERKTTALNNMPSRLGQKPPAPTLDDTSMNREVVRALADLSVLVQGYELTHVSHLTLNGFAYFSEDPWKNLAGPDFNNFGEMHNGLFHSRTDEAVTECAKIHKYVAGEIAWMRKRMDEFAEGPGTMGENTVVVWMTNSGMRHHNGFDAQLLFMLAGKNTKVKAPYWPDFFTREVPDEADKDFVLKGSQHMGAAYATLAQAADLTDITKFGKGEGTIKDVLRA
jgi:hypothetical protein